MTSSQDVLRIPQNNLQYSLLGELGTGSFGTVFKAELAVLGGGDRDRQGSDHGSTPMKDNRAAARREGNLFAIKCIDMESSEEDLDEIQQEIAVLSSVNCPFLTKYHGSYAVGSKLWIVMEFMPGGSIADLMYLRDTNKPTGFGEAACAWIFKDLLRAVAYLHNERRIHRDIKGQNILLGSDGHLKLADFGVTVQLTDTMTKRKTFVGTPFWMAPEVIVQSKYDLKADLWSVGITLIECVTGLPPYGDAHPVKALFWIPKNDPPRLDRGEGAQALSENMAKFVEACLQKDPEHRPSAEELLRHEWLARWEGSEEGCKVLKALMDIKLGADDRGEEGKVTPPKMRKDVSGASSGDGGMDSDRTLTSSNVAAGRGGSSINQSHVRVRRNKNAGRMNPIVVEGGGGEGSSNGGSFWDFGDDDEVDEGDDLESVASTTTTNTTTTSTATTPTGSGKQDSSQFLSEAYVGTVGPALDTLRRKEFAETWMVATTGKKTSEAIKAIQENMETLDLLTNGESTNLLMEKIIENIVSGGSGEGDAE